MMMQVPPKTVAPEVTVHEDERKLTELTQKGKMTDAGQQWLTASLDPFHDGRLHVRGYPT